MWDSQDTIVTVRYIQNTVLYGVKTNFAFADVSFEMFHRAEFRLGVRTVRWSGMTAWWKSDWRIRGGCKSRAAGLVGER